MTTMPDADSIVDVAVVGAGIAGLYTAWRIANSLASGRKRPRTVHLFEAEAKEGGRLVSEVMPTMPFRADLGGMRFTERQLILTSLLKELGIDSKPFEFPTDFFFLRGEILGVGQKVPYRLRKKEDGKSAVDLVRYALAEAIHELILPSNCPEAENISTKIADISAESLTIGSFSARQWEILKRYATLNDESLHAIGFWNLLGLYLSNEAILYARDSFGYQSILANWNAAEAMPWFLRDFGVDYRTISRGMEEIPVRLSYALSKLGNASFTPKRTVLALEQISAPERMLQLSFKETDVTVRARAVVLAVPERPLRAINFIGLPEKEIMRFRDTLESVTRHPLFKLFLGYERPWWNFPGRKMWSSGRSVTDLPIRQVYYFGPDRALDTTTQYAMLMASYTDAAFVDYWRPLHRVPLPGAHENFYYVGQKALSDGEVKLLKGLGASARMVKRAHQQVSRLHPKISDIPQPLVALEKEWPEGWHSWRAHHEPWNIIQQMKRPFSANIHICGEAFSSEQGWIEGALRSAELALRELRLSPPAWMNAVNWPDEDFSSFDEYIGDWNDL